MYCNIYLENTTSDPISVCEALRQQNDALQQELHDIRRVNVQTLNLVSQPTIII